MFPPRSCSALVLVLSGLLVLRAEGNSEGGRLGSNLVETLLGGRRGPNMGSRGSGEMMESLAVRGGVGESSAVNAVVVAGHLETGMEARMAETARSGGLSEIGRGRRKVDTPDVARSRAVRGQIVRFRV